MELANVLMRRISASVKTRHPLRSRATSATFLERSQRFSVIGAMPTCRAASLSVKRRFMFSSRPVSTRIRSYQVPRRIGPPCAAGDTVTGDPPMTFEQKRPASARPKQARGCGACSGHRCAGLLLIRRHVQYWASCYQLRILTSPPPAWVRWPRDTRRIPRPRRGARPWQRSAARSSTAVAAAPAAAFPSERQTAGSTT